MLNSLIKFDPVTTWHRFKEGAVSNAAKSLHWLLNDMVVFLILICSPIHIRPLLQDK